MKVKNFTKKFTAFALGLGMVVSGLTAVGSNRAREVDGGDGISSFTIEFVSQSSGTSDGSTAHTTSTALTSVFVDKDPISKIDDTSKAYCGKKGFGLKLGASSSAGKLNFTLSSSYQIKATSIVANIAQYSATKPVDVTINGTTFNLDTENADFADYSVALPGTGVLSSITMSSTKYCYIKSLTISADSADPGKTVKPTGITIGGYTSTTLDGVGKNSTINLTANVSYQSGDEYQDGNNSVEWSSNKTSVATVDKDSGVVTILDNGEVTITATNSEGDGATNSVTFTVSNIVVPQFFEMSVFTEKSAFMDESEIIQYIGKKGDAGTDATPNSNQLRIYQNGGLFEVKAKTGYKITKIILGSAMATKVQYQLDGGNYYGTDNSITANGTFELDNLSNSSVQFICKGTSNSSRLYVNYLKVYYAQDEIITPTKAIVELVSGKGSYYNGSTGASEFTTSDITVKTYDDNNKFAASYSGTGFKVSVAGKELDASDEVQKVKFTGVTAGTYPISVTVEGVGSNGANVTNSAQTPVNVTILDKQPNEKAFGWVENPKSVFLSHEESLAIKGTLTVEYNDDSSSISSELMKFELFQGESATGTAVYTLTDTVETENYNRIYYKLKSDSGLEIDSGLSFIDNSTILKYYDTTTKFTYKITLLNYSVNNVLSGTVTVNPVSLIANDNTQQTYYLNSEYTLGAEVKIGNRTLDPSEYIINDGNTFTSSTTGPNNITVKLAIDNQICTTYQVDVEEPSIPTSLSITLPNEYVAGDLFHLASDAMVGFKGASTPTPIKETASEISFALVDDSSDSFDEGVSINTNTVMKKSFAGKYVIAHYAEGEEAGIDSSPAEIKAVADAKVESYTPAQEGEWTWIKDTKSLVAGMQIVIASNDKGMTAASIGNKLLNNVSTTFTEDLSGIKTMGADTVEYTLESATGGFKLKNGTSYLGHNKGDITFGSSVSTIWQFSFNTDGDVTMGEDITATSPYRMLYNVGSPRFKTYNSGTNVNMLLPQIYGKTVTPAQGNAVSYLKSIIDSSRLNNELNDQYDIDAVAESTEWTSKAKAIFAGLTDSEKAELGNEKYADTTYLETLNHLDLISTKYTVTWKNSDGTVIDTDEVLYGRTPSFEGSTPTKEPTAQYTYTFTGWSPEVAPVTGDVTYVAQYSSSVNQYTVTWKNGDTTLETDVLYYGDTIDLPTNPTKPSTETSSYEFLYWSLEENGKEATISTVTGNATYYAVFDETVYEKSEVAESVQNNSIAFEGSTAEFNNVTVVEGKAMVTAEEDVLMTIKAEEGKTITGLNINLACDYTVFYKKVGATAQDEPIKLCEIQGNVLKRSVKPGSVNGNDIDLPEDVGEVIVTTTNTSPVELKALSVESAIDVATDLGFFYKGSSITKGQLHFDVDEKFIPDDVVEYGFLMTTNVDNDPTTLGTYDIFDQEVEGFKKYTDKTSLTLGTTNLSKEIKVVFYAIDNDGNLIMSEVVVVSFDDLVIAHGEYLDSNQIVSGNISDAQEIFTNYRNALLSANE